MNNIKCLKTCGIKAALFDFGGVIAEEGFKAGLMVIAEKNGMNRQAILNPGFETVYETGFVTGRVREDAFWAEIRKKTGIQGKTEDLTEEILSRFVIREWMLNLVSDLKTEGVAVGILSDQSHWLDELDKRHNFFHHFDRVFNSYYMGITKKDPSIFNLVIKQLNISPEDILFIDDYLPHIKRAQTRGLKTILYTDKKDFFRQLQKFRK